MKMYLIMVGWGKGMRYGIWGFVLNIGMCMLVLVCLYVVVRGMSVCIRCLEISRHTLIHTYNILIKIYYL